jgi:hypothetical protein
MAWGAAEPPRSGAQAGTLGGGQRAAWGSRCCRIMSYKEQSLVRSSFNFSTPVLLVAANPL